MPNSLTAGLRQILRDQGMEFAGSDDELTGAIAQLDRPELFEKFPDFRADWDAIREANSPGTLGGIKNTAKTAYDRSVQALNVAGGIDATDAGDIAERERSIRDRPSSVPWEDWQKKEGVEAVKVFLRDPIEIVSNIVTAGFAGSLPALAGGLGAGAAAGAAGGPAAPVTGLIGAAAGTGAGSLAVEYGSKYLDVLREAGVDLADPESIMRGVSDPELTARAKDLALRRGIPVAAFDAVSAGLAGKFLKGVRTSTAAQNVRRGLGEAAIQGALGGAGEVAGALSAGEPVRPGAVFEEIVGELGPGAVEVGGAAMRRQMAERSLAPTPAPRAPVAPAPVPMAPPVAGLMETTEATPVAPTVSPARRVALMTDEQRGARYAELGEKMAASTALSADEQTELELLRALVGEADAAPSITAIDEPISAAAGAEGEISGRMEVPALAAATPEIPGNFLPPAPVEPVAVVTPPEPIISAPAPAAVVEPTPSVEAAGAAPDPLLAPVSPETVLVTPPAPAPAVAPEILERETYEELRGQKVQLEAFDSDGRKVAVEMDAAEAWTDTQKRRKIYQTLLDCLKGAA